MKLLPRITLLAAALALTACGGSDTDSRPAPSMEPRQPVSSSGSSSRSVTAVSTFTGNRANYTIVKTATGVSVTDNVGQGGVVNVANPGRLVFADAGVAYDLSGNAGQAYRIYQAAFNRTPDLGGLGYWIDQMDKGATLEAVAAQFIASAEFVTQYGASPSNQDIISKFYENVLHRKPDQAGYDYWVKVLDTRAATTASVLAGFGESPENQQQVSAAIANGIAYTLYKQPVPAPALTLSALSSCPDASASQSKNFYTCMVGTISGKTTFGNDSCSLTIASNGTITLSTGSSKASVHAPYQFAVYSKVTIGAADTFFLVAGVNGSGTEDFDLKVTSPKYAAMSGGISSGIQADLNDLSCKFTL